jgi:hypothetical protein
MSRSCVARLQRPEPRSHTGQRRRLARLLPHGPVARSRSCRCRSSLRAPRQAGARGGVLFLAERIRSSALACGSLNRSRALRGCLETALLRFPDRRPCRICAIAQIRHDYRLMEFREHDADFFQTRRLLTSRSRWRILQPIWICILEPS